MRYLVKMPTQPTRQATLPPGLALRRAGPPDAGTIASLGARLFAQAYGPTHPDPELGEYLARAFRAEDVAAGLQYGGVITYLVEEAGTGAVGYAQLLPGAPLGVSGWAGRPGCEIQRFYLDRPWQGRGVARTMMTAALGHAAATGAEVAWLQVWQEATWAVRFYERAGFVVVGETPFAWGDRTETDWLMAHTLQPASTP